MFQKFVFLILISFVIVQPSWAVDRELLNSELQGQFKNLSEKEQSQFLEKREIILKGLVATLNKARFIFYMTDLIKSGSNGLKDLIMYDSTASGPSDEIKEMIRLDQENHPEKYLDKKRSVRIAEKIDSIVRATDTKLWSQSPLVANANQFSFLFAAGLQAEGGTSLKKWGGFYDLGFSLGYNTETKAVFFQIFRNRESFESTLMPGIAVGGLVVKVGPHIGRSMNNSDLQTTGQSFYPPFVPGYQSTTKESYAFGFSSGLTWPPSPFGDMLTYTNSLDHKVLLKISFSKTFLGFVRVQTNFKSNSIKIVQKKLNELFKPGPLANSCHALF